MQFTIFQEKVVCIDVNHLMIQMKNTIEFTFPPDETLRPEWIRTIPNVILTLNKYTSVNNYTTRILKTK